jgi:hypothetical protein
MNPIPQPQKALEVDPVARSIAKPDAFSKPASMGKPGTPTNANTRIRTMNFKKSRGRKRRPDPRNVHYF